MQTIFDALAKEEAENLGMTLEEYRGYLELDEQIKYQKSLLKGSTAEKLHVKAQKYNNIKNKIRDDFESLSVNSKTKASDIYDYTLAQIDEMKQLLPDINIEAFNIDQQAAIMRRDGSCYIDTDKYAELISDYEELSEAKQTITANMEYLNSVCSEHLAEMLGLPYQDKLTALKQADAEEIVLKAIEYLIDDIDDTVVDAQKAFKLAQQLKGDVIPYLFDQMIDCTQQLVLLNNGYYDIDNIDEYKALYIDEFKRLEDQIFFADSLVSDLTNDNRGSFTLKVKLSDEGKLEIARTDKTNITDKSIWILGTEKTNSYIVGLSDGAIEKQITEYDVRGFGYDKVKEFNGGQTKKDVAIGNLTTAIEKTKGEKAKIYFETDIVKTKKEDIIKITENMALKNTAEFNFGKIAGNIGYDDKKTTIDLSVKGMEVKDTVAATAMNELYNIISAEAAVLSFNASGGMKEIGHIPLPYASAKGLPVSANASVGVNEIKLISAKSLVQIFNLGLSVEDIAINIGNKIFAKTKDVINGSNNAEDIGIATFSSGASSSTTLNSLLWVTIEQTDDGYEIHPMKAEDLDVSSIKGIVKEGADIVKQGLAIGKAVCDTAKEKADERAESYSEMLIDKMIMLENYVR